MNVTITSPFWKQRRDQIVESVIPYPKLFYRPVNHDRAVR